MSTRNKLFWPNGILFLYTRPMRIALLLLLFPLALCALYNGNPSMPMMPETGLFISKDAWVGVKGGYECDWVTRSPLEGASQHRMHHYESWEQFDTLTLNLSDRAEVLAAFGSMQSQLSHSRLSYHAPKEWAWKVGGRAIIAYWGDLQLSMNGSFLKCDPHISSFKFNSVPYKTPRGSIDLTSWQVGVGTAYRFNWCIPYIGVNYMKFRSKLKHVSPLPRGRLTLKNALNFGLFFGVGLGLEKAVSLNAEARFISENALSMSADFKF